MFKMCELFSWEYILYLGCMIEQVIGVSEDCLNWMWDSFLDYEIVLFMYEMVSFVCGEGYYSGLLDEMCFVQIVYMCQLSEQFYLCFRFYFFDV